MKCIILTGSSGDRLWPMARTSSPKELLKLYNNDKTLLQNIFENAMALTDAKNIVTVTNFAQETDTKLQLKNYSNKPIVISEPLVRNSAPSITCALNFIKRKRDDIAVILPADFIITNKKSFLKTIEAAKLSAQEGNVVAIGVKPSYAEEGFGYIKAGSKSGSAYAVEQFTEKPSLELAQEFFKDKKYFWNTGIYVAKISVLLSAIEEYAPDIYSAISPDIIDKNNKIKYEDYENLPSISIDYAVIEKIDNLTFVELKTKWSDMSSWKSIYDNSPKDSDGNVISGNVICNKVKNSFVFSQKELVAVSGVNDKIIVDTEDALLVCDNEKAKEISKIVNALKNIKSKTVEEHKTVFRPWGFYTCLNSGKGWLTKIITVAAGHKLSLQSHNHRSEHWVVLEGEATVILDNEKHILNKAQSIDIPLNAVHSLQNHTNSPLKILEVQKGDYISENDIIRYEDIYGRVNV